LIPSSVSVPHSVISVPSSIPRTEVVSTVVYVPIESLPATIITEISTIYSLPPVVLSPCECLDQPSTPGFWTWVPSHTPTPVPVFPSTLVPIHITRVPSSVSIPSSIIVSIPSSIPTEWVASTIVLVPVTSLPSLPTTVITHISFPSTVVIPSSIATVIPPPAFPTTLVPIHVSRIPSSVSIPSSIIVSPPTNYPTTWIPDTIIFVPVTSLPSLPSTVITHISIPSTVVIPSTVATAIPPPALPTTLVPIHIT